MLFKAATLKLHATVLYKVLYTCINLLILESSFPKIPSPITQLKKKKVLKFI